MSIVQRKIWLQSLSADRTTKPFWSRNPRLERFSLKKKKEKEKTTKKIIAKDSGWMRCWLFPVILPCVPRSRLPKQLCWWRIWLMLFFSNTVPLVSVTFNWRMAGIPAPPTGPPKCFNVCTFYVKYNKWEQRGNFFFITLTLSFALFWLTLPETWWLNTSSLHGRSLTFSTVVLLYLRLGATCPCFVAFWL